MKAFLFYNKLAKTFYARYRTVEINISLNNSSSLSFLNVYAPLFASPQRMAEPIPFLPPAFPPPEISSFWGTSIAITPLGLKRYFRPPQGGRIRLDHLF